MVFDYKKQYRQFYQPKNTPELIDIPKMNYAAVHGKGDPSEKDGEYQESIALLYGLSYTIKMSKNSDHKIEGYFDYVIPPLEGLWWQEKTEGIDYRHKETFNWISMIRLPDFVSEEDFAWAINEAGRKKKKDFTKVGFFTLNEGLCVQCMHNGAFADEPSTIRLMDEFIEQNGYENDFSDLRKHHEIYLSDPRKTAMDKLKTLIRHPVKERKTDASC